MNIRATSLPRVISFDCADTLLVGDWTLPKFIFSIFNQADLAPSDDEIQIYVGLFRKAYPDYLRVNLTRNNEITVEHWNLVCAVWLTQTGRNPDLVKKIALVTYDMIYGSEPKWFIPFKETYEVLTKLKAAGHKLIVVSNWDTSLRPILKRHRLLGFFDEVVASLEEGIEKPDPRLFDVALARINASQAEVLHVGDSLEDDVVGAQNAGIAYRHLVRTGDKSGPHTIQNLRQLLEFL